MTPEELADALWQAVTDAVAVGELPALSDAVLVDAPVRPAGGPRHGWASPVAFRVASVTGLPVTTVAGLLADRLALLPSVATVSVRDGFLEVVPRSEVAALRRAVAEGEAYGRVGSQVLGPPPRWAAAASAPRTRANPLLLVQLARARLVRAHGREDVASAPDTPGGERHSALMSAVALFPSVAGRAVGARDPEILARFLEGVAANVVSADPDLDPDLDPALDPDLVAALVVVLTNGLQVLGTATPSRI